MRHIVALIYVLLAAIMGVGLARIAQVNWGLWTRTLSDPLVLSLLTIPVLFLIGAVACYASSKKRYVVLALPWLYLPLLFVTLASGYTGDF